MSGFSKLSGDLASLKRVSRTDWDEVHQKFQEESLYDSAGLRSPPKKEPLFEDLDEDELIVFKLTSESTTGLRGYGVFVNYDGPPYIFVHFFDGEVDVELAADAMLLMVHAFFKHSEEPRLYTFLPKPVNDDIHDRLLEGGFDFIEDYPVIDNDVEAAYCIERFTYEAYYEDEEDDEVEELDF